MIDRIEIIIEPKFHHEHAPIPTLAITISDGLKTEYISTNLLWPPRTLEERFEMLFDAAKEELWKLIKKGGEKDEHKDSL